MDGNVVIAAEYGSELMLTLLINSVSIEKSWWISTLIAVFMAWWFVNSMNIVFADPLLELVDELVQRLDLKRIETKLETQGKAAAAASLMSMSDDEYDERFP